MTDFFNYADLTWPEVSALPRHTPLVIPFGNAYSRSDLRQSLQFPPTIGILPFIPFGWQGSPLPVDERRLELMVKNIVVSLRDDGFLQVFISVPQGICVNLDVPRIIQSERKGQLLPMAMFPADSEREKVVLIPIGHTEQHSHHLPLSTDTLIIAAIAQEIQNQIPTRAVALPVMPYGVSMHRKAFAGTLNVGGREFEDFWLDVIDQLILRGFTKIYLLSGHGGNCSFLTNVVKYAGERYYQAFIATAWLYLSGLQGIASLKKYRQSSIGGMGHACELETSLLLHLRPDLVHMDRVIDETSFIATESYYMDWVEGGALIANPPWEDDVSQGAYGAGSLGTAEKGSIWLYDAVAEKIAHVEEIHTQYSRRMKRRIALSKK